LKQAQAEVQKDKADLQGVAAAIRQQQPQIEQAQAEVENTEAALTFSTQELEMTKIRLSVVSILAFGVKTPCTDPRVRSPSRPLS
jgi:multidrug resistance efflux pump